MAGGAEKVDTTKLTGLSRIFNAETNFGRANVSFSPELTPMLHNCAQSIVSTTFNTFYTYLLQVAKATYASIGLLVLYFTLKPKKK